MTDRKPAVAMPGVTPHLTIPSRGGEAALEFYGRAFGAVVQSKMLAEDGERLMHAHLTINGGAVLLHDEFPEHNGLTDITPIGAVMHMEVDDADAWWDRALTAGAVPVHPLTDQFWGARYGQVKDPFGHCWSISGPLKT